jgi:hypothetical protein
MKQLEEITTREEARQYLADNPGIQLSPDIRGLSTPAALQAKSDKFHKMSHEEQIEATMDHMLDVLKKLKEEKK